MPCKSTASPGPAYVLPSQTGYQNHDYTKYRSPAFSFGLRTNAYPRKDTPGPYKVVDCDRFGRFNNQGFSIAPRVKYPVPFSVPGPGTYAPSRTNYGPFFTIKGQVQGISRKQGPSAAEYYPQAQRTGGFSIYGRFDEVKRWQAPTAGAPPIIDAYKPRAPSFSLGVKSYPGSNKTPSPGPIYYPKRVCCKEPRYSYSFGVKHSECTPPMITYDDNN